jgi:hypothetical protein
MGEGDLGLSTDAGAEEKEMSAETANALIKHMTTIVSSWSGQVPPTEHAEVLKPSVQ